MFLCSTIFVFLEYQQWIYSDCYFSDRPYGHSGKVVALSPSLRSKKIGQTRLNNKLKNVANKYFVL